MRHKRAFGDTIPAIAACQIAALSSSHSCFCRPKRKKPAKANHALRVLSPDPFVLLTLSLCHNEKNKSRTFPKKPEKVPSQSSARKEWYISQYLSRAFCDGLMKSAKPAALGFGRAIASIILRPSFHRERIDLRTGKV